MEKGLTVISETIARQRASEYKQDHVFRFWGQLNPAEREQLLHDLDEVDFPLMQRLIDKWVLNEPPAEHFSHIEPVPVIPFDDPGGPEAWEAGETALRNGRVGLFLVAGGQGTRLGFPGPKGVYPVGPLTQKSFFHYHAEKILNLRRRYGCGLPWYIMVSQANSEATRAFFDEHGYFGLGRDSVQFIIQRMVPCVDTNARFMLETPCSLATNPNGHGGCIPAMVENGILDDARKRGIDILSFFQVDNWAAKVADPRFIGYHVLRNAEMSSKNHRKNHPREAVGVHCLCDGKYHVIEYSELDIYPQLLQTDANGNIICYAGNPAIHILSVDFVQRVYEHFEDFPWHRAFKKIPYINDKGERVNPEKPNGYKFETFVFDALQFIQHPPLGLEIPREGEYTPTKQYDGDNSVVAARHSMNSLWSKWLDAAGSPVSRQANGQSAITIEISPAFALDQNEFLEKSNGKTWPTNGDLAIDAHGHLEYTGPATIPS